MPQTLHVEKYFTAGDTVRDIVIGMANGLTVQFALAAGLKERLLCHAFAIARLIA